MIVGIVGNETTDLANKDKQIWIIKKINELTDRILAKEPNSDFIIGSHSGVEQAARKTIGKRGIPYFVLSIFEYEFPNAELTFFSPDSQFAELVDYMIIFTNGQPHARLDRIKSNIDHLNINWLSRKEQWIRC